MFSLIILSFVSNYFGEWRGSKRKTTLCRHHKKPGDTLSFLVSYLIERVFLSRYLFYYIFHILASNEMARFTSSHQEKAHETLVRYWCGAKSQWKKPSRYREAYEYDQALPRDFSGDTWRIQDFLLRKSDAENSSICCLGAKNHDKRKMGARAFPHFSLIPRLWSRLPHTYRE